MGCRCQGVSIGSKLAEQFGIPSQIAGGGRISVTPYCSIEGFSNIYALGDMTNFVGEDGKPLPGVAPVAMQQGEYVGKRIHDLVLGVKNDKPFRYWDKGKYGDHWPLACDRRIG